MINAKALLGSHDIVFITLDTLRYDVAQSLCQQNRIPNLRSVIPDGKWEERHSPGNFTFAAHVSFFAGFLPTPITPIAPGQSRPGRLFAAKFVGSETTTEQTCTFDSPDIVNGLATCGYHTVCIGGTGFFNPATPLGRVLPGLFKEAHWSRELGVTEPRSTEFQVALAVKLLQQIPVSKRLFLFMNVSALHQPNYFYLGGATSDSLESHAAALEYVDSQLGELFSRIRKRASALVIICSDHGTAYGEDGYWGHRIAHPVVWTVPYAEFVLQGTNKEERQ